MYPSYVRRFLVGSILRRQQRQADAHEENPEGLGFSVDADEPVIRSITIQNSEGEITSDFGKEMLIAVNFEVTEEAVALDFPKVTLSSSLYLSELIFDQTEENACEGEFCTQYRFELVLLLLGQLHLM